MDYKYFHLPECKEPIVRQNIVVLSGAGISAESGLLTFRDENGLWKQFDLERLASAAGFYEDPEPALEFYNALRKDISNAEPNHAHNLLAELEKWHNVTIITQNVDNLHERAGSSNVMHIHGEMAKVTSSIDRNNPDFIKEYPLDIPIRIGDKAADGSQLRPHIVLFDEYVQGFDNATKFVKEADIFLIIGTSLNVYPAASLVRYAHPEIPKFIIDTNEEITSSCNDLGFEHINEKATIGIELFIDRLIELLE